MRTNPLESSFRQAKFVSVVVLLIFLVLSNLKAGAQGPSAIDRDRAKVMLTSIKNDLKKDYYDPSFHGLDIDARFKVAEQKLNEATSIGQMFGIVAQAVLDLNDSHTFFIPPQRASRTDYGWVMQIIGDRCYVTGVKPGSDAEKKGLKPGDLVLSVNGFAPARENLWKMRYLFYTLRPQATLRVEVQSPGQQQPRVLDVAAKITQGRRLVDLSGGAGSDAAINDLIREIESEDRLNAQRYVESGDDVFIWRMPGFNLSESDVDSMMNKARKHKSVILDLRGNGGGYLVTLQRLLGNLFEHEVKIADVKRRKDSKPLVSKPRGKDAFTGKLVVLVDCESASASELLAKVVQLEKRGKVIGDKSAGAVMQAIHHEYQSGADVMVFYSASITDADLLMTDGKSLEGVGVTPDEIVLPTGGDLAANRIRCWRAQPRL